MEEEPYLFETIMVKKRKYNPKYGDDKECQCGHPYSRHFDSYDEMAPAGCKYCGCFVFIPKEKKILGKHN